MATKTFYATKDLKNPSYGTRMLKAGDPVELDGPKARLYLALGAVSPDAPKVAKVATAPPVTPPPAAPTATAPKRKARAKKAAKKAK